MAQLADEEPVLIHPEKDEPESLIGFRAEYAFPENNDARARITINDVLHLNDRSPLVEQRRDHLDVVQKMKRIVQLAGKVPDDLVLEAKAWLAKATSDEAEYASMTRAALKS